MQGVEGGGVGGEEEGGGEGGQGSDSDEVHADWSGTEQEAEMEGPACVDKKVQGAEAQVEAWEGRRGARCLDWLHGGGQEGGRGGGGGGDRGMRARSRLSAVSTT